MVRPPPPERPAGLLFSTAWCARGLALGAALAAGCVVPISPQFGDPEINTPPSVVTSTYKDGETVTYAPGWYFDAVVADANALDTLYYTWVLDYPPAASARPTLSGDIPPGPNGSDRRTIPRLSPDCVLTRPILPGPSHTLMLIVSDRPFATGTLDVTTTGGYVIKLLHRLDWECP